MVAVAIGAAAVLGAGASVIGGHEAASATEHAANQANATDMAMYNQSRADEAPYRAAGAGALTALEGAYGLPGGASSPGTGSGASSGDGYGGFFKTPGYNFEMNQGLQAVDRNESSQGLLGSGGAVKAKERYAEGLASGNFNQYTSGLDTIAGLGQGSTGTTAAAGSTAANTISNNLMSSGNAAAAAYANTASSINSGVNNIMSAYLMRGMFANGGGNSAMAIGMGG